MSRTRLPATTPAGLLGLLARLHSIKLGGGGADPASQRIRGRDLAYILRNLATLMENGVSLPRALRTLAQESSLKKYAGMLNMVRGRVEAGESFSGALATCPHTFGELTVNQIRVGERSGTIAETLGRVATQLEKANELRSKIIKRLSYPIIVTVAGTGVVTFMLTYVVPQFEETYKQARIPLPAMTQLMIGVGHFATNYGWMLAVIAIGGALALAQARKNDHFAFRMDKLLLRLPLIGDCLRDIAVLQFVDVLGVMMLSGFRLVDALRLSVNAIGNRAVRSAVEDLRTAVMRGERLSRQLDCHGSLFPPTVSQLVIVGEQTGNLGKATTYVREHLRQQVERKADILVSMIEPTLTIGMAVVIGIILLAVYMPMFGMIDAVE